MSEAIRVVFASIADVRSIAAPYTEIVHALHSRQDVVLDMSAVEEADLTLIQLILAARRTADETDQSFTLAGPAPEPVARLLERGGFIGPAPDSRRDFWLAS